jgi:galactoside O-acetyltransferase
VITVLEKLARSYLRERRSAAFVRLVSKSGAIGSNNTLSGHAEIREAGGSIVIGDNSNLACTLICESSSSRISIGNRVYIGSRTLLDSAISITVEDDVFIAWGVSILDHNSHSVYFTERQNDQYWLLEQFEKDWGVVVKAPVTVGERSWIGFNSIILKGVTIGHDAVVAAGSVVTKPVAPFTIVGGNPAREIGSCDAQSADMSRPRTHDDETIELLVRGGRTRAR